MSNEQETSAAPEAAPENTAPKAAASATGATNTPSEKTGTGGPRREGFANRGASRGPGGGGGHRDRRGPRSAGRGPGGGNRSGGGSGSGAPAGQSGSGFGGGAGGGGFGGGDRGRGGNRGRGGQGGGGGRGRRGDRRDGSQGDLSEYTDKVVHVNRCAKVVKGGRRFSFAALVVSGDGKGRIGIGYGKAKEVPEAIRKGTDRAHRALRPVNLRANTIPHEVYGEFDGGRVLLRPASPGTGVIAGGGVRAVLEVVGIKDVLSKSLGSNNPLAIVKATINGLLKLRTLEQIRAVRAPVEPEPAYEGYYEEVAPEAGVEYATEETAAEPQA